MKIKNDLVSIKIGKKQYDFKNLILDEYLKTFARAQLEKEQIRKLSNQKSLKYLLIKFDTPIENLNEKSYLKNSDFDIVIVMDFYYKQEENDNLITVQYTYTIINPTVWAYDKNDQEGINGHAAEITDFLGKKITALGFNSWWAISTSSENPVKAVLDTSNYNIYLQENQDFVVTRKDIISTDAIFYTSNKSKVPAPLHLMPINNKAVIKPTEFSKEENGITSFISGENESHGIIYSIGLSSYIDRIDKEFVIGEDVEITQNGAELEIKGLNNAISREFIYPNKNIYPSSNLYPTKSNYKYLIIKYKVWQELLSGTYDNPVYTITDTGYFYHQVLPITKFGDLNLKIKYERG